MSAAAAESPGRGSLRAPLSQLRGPEQVPPAPRQHSLMEGDKHTSNPVPFTHKLPLRSTLASQSTQTTSWIAAAFMNEAPQSPPPVWAPPPKSAPPPYPRAPGKCSLRQPPLYFREGTGRPRQTTIPSGDRRGGRYLRNSLLEVFLLGRRLVGGRLSGREEPFLVNFRDRLPRPRPPRLEN